MIGELLVIIVLFIVLAYLSYAFFEMSKDKQVHAHWVGHFEDDSYSAPGQFRCSLCGAMAGLKTDGNYAALTRFCPHCGAKMDEKVAE